MIMMIVGYPASGKSTVATTYIDQGFVYVNRDTAGGRVIDLLVDVISALRSGKNVVLDNTFPTRESRAPFIKAAQDAKQPVVCALMNTTIEEAQFNACLRMARMRDKILSPQEIKADKSPNIFPPAVLFAYRKQFEKPTESEGFERIQKIPFVRRFDVSWVNKAIFLDYDGTIRQTRSGAKWPTNHDDIEILPNVGKVLDRWLKQGYRLLGVSNQSAIANRSLTDQQARSCFEATNALLKMQIEYAYCPHNPAPISCYCRKPMPGLAVGFFVKYKLDPQQCIMVGDQTSDKTFADRACMQFAWAKDFFA